MSFTLAEDATRADMIAGIVADIVMDIWVAILKAILVGMPACQ